MKPCSVLELVQAAVFQITHCTGNFFTDLLRNYAKRFARSKSLNISHYPLNFAGFYHDKKVGSGYGEKRGVNSEFSQMGRCFTEKVIYPIKQKIANISLNRLYLLNE